MPTIPLMSRLTDRKRESIVQAAIDEFRTHGLAATSVDRIALRAAVSKRTLYNHFPSKEALFAEILAVLWENSAGRADLAFRADLPLRQQLIDLALVEIARLTNDNFVDLARVAFTALIDSAELVEETVNRLAGAEDPLLDWIRDARKHGQLKPCDTALAAQQFMSLIKGAVFWPQMVLGEKRPSLREKRKQAIASVDMFLSRYAVDPDHASGGASLKRRARD